MKQSGMPAMFIWMLMPRKVYYPTVITKKIKIKMLKAKSIGKTESTDYRKNWKYRLQKTYRKDSSGRDQILLE